MWQECDKKSIPEGGARGKGETGYNIFVVQVCTCCFDTVKKMHKNPDQLPNIWCHSCFLFSQQEKLFTAALGISNLKVRNGQHCSYRWSTMHVEEKRLYELIAAYKNKQVFALDVWKDVIVAGRSNVHI